jgi:hypothetical protein
VGSVVVTIVVLLGLVVFLGAIVLVGMRVSRRSRLWMASRRGASPP